jgi:hypothetical protein
MRRLVKLRASLVNVSWSNESNRHAKHCVLRRGVNINLLEQPIALRLASGQKTLLEEVLRACVQRERETEGRCS